MFVFEWSVSVGNLITLGITLATFIGGFIGSFYAFRIQNAIQGEILKNLTSKVSGVEIEVKELKNVLITLAAHNAQIVEMNNRMDRVQTTFESRFEDVWKELSKRS